MKKSNLKFSHCLFAGVTFLLPLAVLVAVALYLHEKFALAIRDIYVPIYKSLGLYDRLPRHVMAFGAELVTVLVGVIVFAFVGWIVLRVVRRRRIQAFHQFLENIPLVKTVFSPVKQAVDSLFGSGLSDGNRKVVRFPYPAEPYQTVGIVMDEISEGGEKKYLVLLPLTMSAGTGLLLTVPQAVTTEVPISATQALEHIISCGMVKLSAKCRRKGVRVTGVQQFWDAVRDGEPVIELHMSEGVKVALPADEKELIPFFCKVVYGRVDAKAKKMLRGGWLFSLSNSMHRVVNMKWYYAKKLKGYSCRVVDGTYIQLRKDAE